tara:strand:- start:14141 stop:14371 length:231 start_codon:yes stop_codon:yes gene_type:complete
MKTKDRVFNCIKRQMGKSDINLSTDLKNDLKADDLDYIELTMRLESEFGIAIDDEKFSTLKTVNDVYRYVTELADA